MSSFSSLWFFTYFRYEHFIIYVKVFPSMYLSTLLKGWCPLIFRKFHFHEVPLINCWSLSLHFGRFCSESHFRWVPTFSSIDHCIRTYVEIIHPFWIQFVQGYKYGSIYIFLHPAIQCGQNNLLKMLYFSNMSF